MRFSKGIVAAALSVAAGLAFGQAKEIRIAHVYGKTGALEAYAKQTQAGLLLGLEYATGGKMEVLGRKIVLIEKDDQIKPDIAKSALATAFTAPAQRMFDALKGKPGRKIIGIIWAGPNPVTKIADLQPGRFGIELAPGGNILPVMKTWKALAGVEGAIYYYYGFPKNKTNDWLVAEYKKRYRGTPPDFFVAGGMAPGIPGVEAIKKAGGTHTEKLIAAMEGLTFDSPKGPMTLRKEDHQALQSMYQFRIKKEQKDEWDLLDLVREIPAREIPLPIRNKK